MNMPREEMENADAKDGRIIKDKTKRSVASNTGGPLHNEHSPQRTLLHNERFFAMNGTNRSL